MIDLEKEHLKQIKVILQRFIPDSEVRVFGSRVNDSAGKFSDLDLVVLGTDDQSEDLLIELKAAFSISDLPFVVDVVHWESLPKILKEKILEKSEVIQISRN